MSMYKDLANELSYENENLTYDNSILKDDIKAILDGYDKLLQQHKMLVKDIAKHRAFDDTDIKCLTDDIRDFEEFLDEFCYYID